MKKWIGAAAALLLGTAAAFAMTEGQTEPPAAVQAEQTTLRIAPAENSGIEDSGILPLGDDTVRTISFRLSEQTDAVWSVRPERPGLCSIDQNGVLSIFPEHIRDSREPFSVTVSAEADGQRTEYQFYVQHGPVCEARPVAGKLECSQLRSGVLTAEGYEPAAAVFEMGQLVFEGLCTYQEGEGHDAHHGQYLTLSNWKTEPPQEGVSINPAGILQVDKTVPDGTDLEVQAEILIEGNPTGVVLERSFRLERHFSCDVVLRRMDFANDSPSVFRTDEEVSRIYALNLVFSGKCNLPEHENDSTHGMQIDYKLAAMPGNSLEGISVDSKGVLRADSSLMPSQQTQIRLIASCGKISASKQIQVEREKQCSLRVTALKISGGTQNVLLSSGEKGQVSYSADVTYEDPDAICDYGDSIHENQHTLIWVLTKQVDGVQIDPDTGVLTVEADKLPAMHNTIKVQVQAGEVKSEELPVIVTRPALLCSRKISEIGTPLPVSSAPARATLDFSGEIPVLTTSGSVTTVSFSTPSGYPVLQGFCEFEGSAQCPRRDNHSIRWSLEQPCRGVEIDPVTGLLTVSRRSLSAEEQEITVVASAGGTSEMELLSSSCRLLIRRGAQDDGSDGNEVINQRQWNSIESRILVSESGAEISADISGNTNIPVAVLKELKDSNITLNLKAGPDFWWIINGMNLKNFPSGLESLPVAVSMLEEKDASGLARGTAVFSCQVENDGSLYGTWYLSAPVEEEYQKQPLFLYKYVPDSDKLIYKGHSDTSIGGSVNFPMTSGGIYIITCRTLYSEVLSGIDSSLYSIQSAPLEKREEIVPVSQPLPPSAAEAEEKPAAEPKKPDYRAEPADYNQTALFAAAVLAALLTGTLLGIFWKTPKKKRRTGKKEKIK